MTVDDLDRVQRNELGRRHVESAEWWLRRLIHHQMSSALGMTYLTTGQLPRRLHQRILSQIENAPGRIAREVDATTFEQAIDIVCHPDRWRAYFEVALQPSYPLGEAEARFFLNQIKDIRNDLSHGRSISTRQLEKSICYANDLSDAIKLFFRGAGMSRAYDVPMIVRYSDNLGNESDLTGISTDINLRILDLRRVGLGDIYPGQNLISEIEIDPSYQSSGYKIYSRRPNWPHHEVGTKASVLIENQHVSEQFELRFQVITDREWHRQNGIDDALIVVFRVLPPIG